MITTHSAIHLVRFCHGQMSLIAVSYPIIFIHGLTHMRSAALSANTFNIMPMFALYATTANTIM